MDHHEPTNPGDDLPEMAAADRDLESLERALSERGEPYARATVVRREPPVSATVGDRALVTADGELVGWIGGVACAQSAVEREARNALEDGEPRLVGLAPDPDDVDRPGLEAHPMTCHGEGTLEVFVEPVVPTSRLLVVGGSPIARSLVRLAEELALETSLVDPDAEAEVAGELPEGTTILRTLEPSELADTAGQAPFVVVATMGAYDARGVAVGVLADAPYVGLVSSEKRATTVAERAAEILECDPEAVAEAVTSPAGVDVGARTPAEIAVSVLAEVVEVRAKAGTEGTPDTPGCCRDGADATEGIAAEADTTEAAAEADTTEAAVEVDTTEAAAEADATDVAGVDERRDPAERRGRTDERGGVTVDPVCGMTVEPDDAADSVTYENEVYHFCCPGCADAFRDDPGAYLTSDGDPVEAR